MLNIKEIERRRAIARQAYMETGSTVALDELLACIVDYQIAMSHAMKRLLADEEREAASIAAGGRDHA